MSTPTTHSGDDICSLTATELAAQIRARQLSARDVMSAHLERIDRINPATNAIVTLVAERAMADAARADEVQACGEPLGVLHGLPVAHKDLVETAGIRTTYGSPLFRDNVPAHDAAIVTRMRQAGAITIGKTNTPEFGAGSQTFNDVFGATRNPYDRTKTCGGSSGGAAVALACGMIPIADGSDTGGSLRNPAAFCNVVGFRPSPGLVPNETAGWSPLSVNGPMARTVSDVALLLSAMAGPDSRMPLSIDGDPKRFAPPLDSNVRGARVAWWKGLGGIPFEPELRRVVDENRAIFESLGCIVEEDEPNFAGVDDAFLAMRHAAFTRLADQLRPGAAGALKDTIRWEIAEAERTSAATVARGFARQTQFFEQTARFFERHDFFVLPVTQVSPFDLSIPYPTSIEGTPMTTYVDWMRSCWYVSFMATPAISVPGGFTKDGLPVGLQIVGRYRADLSVLQMAYAFEQATRHGDRRPRL
ncbi:MAG: amidase [Gemmatimonadaceae bacterium]